MIVPSRQDILTGNRKKSQAVNIGYKILVVRWLVKLFAPCHAINGRTGNRSEDPPTFHTRSRCVQFYENDKTTT